MFVCVCARTCVSPYSFFFSVSINERIQQGDQEMRGRASHRQKEELNRAGRGGQGVENETKSLQKKKSQVKAVVDERNR